MKNIQKLIRAGNFPKCNNEISQAQNQEICIGVLYVVRTENCIKLSFTELEERVPPILYHISDGA